MRGTGVSDAGPAGLLQVVATPIGNLGDLSPRALASFRSADWVACEDTRHTGRLLAAHDVSVQLISYHEHNAQVRAVELVARLRGGEVGVLVTDAGTPAISDPGYRLVDLAHREGVPVVAVPGPTAVIAALSIAGLPSDRFGFEGFLPTAKGARRARLETIAREWRAGGGRTIVILESARRLAGTLGELGDAWGDLRCAVCREMTKRFEEVVRGTTVELAGRYAESVPRGEIVIVVDLRSGDPPPPPEDSAEPAVDVRGRARALLAQGLTARDAVRALRRSGIDRRAARAEVERIRAESDGRSG